VLPLRQRGCSLEESVLDGSQFDGWTRRRFGAGSAGLLIAVLGLAEQERALAKGKKHKKGAKKGKKKKKNDRGCSSDAQFCREDWAAYCNADYEPAEAQACIAASAPCCDLYGACNFDAAFACEDNIDF
jgi:hypothetical protein